uniref:Uncharacterized protein n=2 Tax=Anopheles albimanus TaxID=7167 RepID=A0A182FF84_ANOAL
MFNDRKLTPGHGFVKAYSNNWLSHLGSVYKYESPKDVPRKPNHQHRKIALYSILAMAFVAFFTLFMIVHEADRKMRRQVIVSSFDNETAIEPSAGGLNTVLTTPFSSSSRVQDVRFSQEASEELTVSSHREPPSPKRTRRLRYYGEGEGRLHVGRDQLVLHPARTLNPPAPQLVSSVSGASREEVVASRRFDEPPDQAKPRPFLVKLQGPVPVGFQQPLQPQQQHHTDHHDSRMNRSVDGIDWGALNIQDIIRQLTLAKRQQQQLHYPYKATAVQPSEFNHPVYQNHRLKFTGIYRHPRKNGDITTLFGAASKRPQEVVLQAPQLINQQLQHVMPDPLYNFKPQDPSDVNLLATEQFRFAPQEHQAQQQQQHPRQGMPFSVMLNLEPMPIVGRPALQQQQPYRKRFQNQYRNQRYLGQPTWSAGAGTEQSFAQLAPYRTRPVYGGSGEYDDRENYFRRTGQGFHQQYQRLQQQQTQGIPAFASPLIGPGRLMIHFNIFPKQQQQPVTAQRKSEVTLASGELNTWEERTQDQDRTSSEPTVAPTVPSPWIGSLIGARDTQSSVAPPTTAPTPTVEVIKSIEIPTQINFDHIPLGRHPPSPRPPNRNRGNPWAGDEAIWGKNLGKT